MRRLPGAPYDPLRRSRRSPQESADGVARELWSAPISVNVDARESADGVATEPRVAHGSAAVGSPEGQLTALPVILDLRTAPWPSELL